MSETTGERSEEELQEAMEKLGARLASIKNEIRQLKKDGAAQEIVTAKVNTMKGFQADMEVLQQELAGPQFDKEGMEETLIRRMIYVPSFEIHGGSTGFFDFGPVGCGLKDNIISLWKKHFVLNERMLQVEATCLTAAPVLETSGHVERFIDLMCKDEQTGFCYRADKLLEDHIENLIDAKPDMPKNEKEELLLIHRQADAFTPEELGKLINERFQIKAPDSGNPLTDPFPFNLMFSTPIGPSGGTIGYLRPETAQGIFVNFKRLLDYNNGRVPFAAAQVGLGFRNEISPRHGLIRVREFTMAEIEHFVHPEEKDHPKFSTVKDVKLTLFPSSNQMTTGKVIQTTAGQAVKDGIIDNETLAYFVARTHLFLEKVGVDMERVRFRQHLPTEMAHYASDCWDAEIKLSMGWVEIAGHADRACYDLQVHSEATGESLKAGRRLNPPKEIEILKVAADKKVMGKTFKRESKVILEHIENMDLDEAVKMGEKLAAGETVDLTMGDKVHQLTSEMKIVITRVPKLIHEEKFYPSVIEPSFGIGRILYSILEHGFYLRQNPGDEDKDAKVEKGSVSRTVFKFKPLVAPIKCGVCPLLRDDILESISFNITERLIDADLFSQCDTTNSAIGRKYARLDEIGVPFCVTVDKQTTEDNTVTLRERDSQQQVRLPINSLVEKVSLLCSQAIGWQDLIQEFPPIN